MIAVIDYGMGNLTSVAKALRFLGANPQITSDPKQVARAQALVFPGVGAFGAAMRELKVRKLIHPIVGGIRDGKPFLGLCLGLQLLFEASEESPGVKGLGVLKGRVRRLPRAKDLKVPHMGWNRIHRSSFIVHRSSINNQRSTLLKGIPDGAFMYFVHSFYAQPEEKEIIVAMTQHGCRFPAALSNGERLWATQFHPEKSQRWGLQILKNFLRAAAASGSPALRDISGQKLRGSRTTAFGPEAATC